MASATRWKRGAYAAGRSHASASGGRRGRRGAFEAAAFTFALQSDPGADIGEIGQVEAGLLGVDAITLSAMRPDGYVGLRADRDHLQALKRYRRLILEGTRGAVTAA